MKFIARKSTICYECVLELFPTIQIKQIYVSIERLPRTFHNELIQNGIALVKSLNYIVYTFHPLVGGYTSTYHTWFFRRFHTPFFKHQPSPTLFNIHRWRTHHLQHDTDWWLNQPIWKIVKLDHFLKVRAENKKIWNHHLGCIDHFSHPQRTPIPNGFQFVWTPQDSLSQWTLQKKFELDVHY